MSDPPPRVRTDGIVNVLLNFVSPRPHKTHPEQELKKYLLKRALQGQLLECTMEMRGTGFAVRQTCAGILALILGGSVNLAAFLKPSKLHFLA